MANAEKHAVPEYTVTLNLSRKEAEAVRAREQGFFVYDRAATSEVDRALKAAGVPVPYSGGNFSFTVPLPGPGIDSYCTVQGANPAPKPIKAGAVRNAGCERQVALYLTEREAETLLEIASMTGGNPETSARAHADSVRKALYSVNVKPAFSGSSFQRSGNIYYADGTR